MTYRLGALSFRPEAEKLTPPLGGLPTRSLRGLRTGLLGTSFGRLSPPQFPEELTPQLARSLHRLLSELLSPLLRPLLSGLLLPLRPE